MRLLFFTTFNNLKVNEFLAIQSMCSGRIALNAI